MAGQPMVMAAENVRIEIKKVEKEKDLCIFQCHFWMREDGRTENGESELVWKFPCLNCAGVWHPNCRTDRSIHADWDNCFESMTASSAPVLCVFGENGENRMTLALSETREKMKIHAGIHEEDGTVQLQVRVPNVYAAKTGMYELEIWLDRRNILYYEAIGCVSQWWEKDCQITAAPAGDAVYEPVYSSWYAFHQELEQEQIEKECRLASEIGFHTIILDDGWQTDDNSRGYAFCGDWQVSRKRFPDFRGHIQNVHDMGMKYMIWYSVPLLGCRAAKWKEFKDKILSYHDDLNAGVLDPRYPEIREYLVQICLNGIREWNLDGFKLDFIDEVEETKETPPYNEEMDFWSVQEALDCLMKQIYDGISREKPGVMVEFRQRYIGPNMRRYGNMFRVTDCPDSAIKNRVEIVNLRMLSGMTAVHSDPIMWHKEEKPELVALQMIASIFATPQISVRLSEASEEIRKLVAFWIGFVRKHKELLQKQQLRPQEPQNLYPEVWTVGNGQAAGAVYTKNRVIVLPKEADDIIILNGTTGTRMILDSDLAGTYEIVIKDCMGGITEKLIHVGAVQLFSIKVSVGGQVYIRRS